MGEQLLDELDYKILNLISNDARISFLEVSRACNVSGASVHQRVQKMMTNGIILKALYPKSPSPSRMPARMKSLRRAVRSPRKK